MKKLEAGNRKQEAGISVIAVTTTLLLLILFAAVASSLVSVRANINAEAVNAKRALYLAESGLATTKKTLLADWSLYSNPSAFPLTSFAGGTFDADITPGSNPSSYVIVTSTGVYGNSQRVIESTVSRYSALSDAVYTEQDFVQFGSAVVNGTITEFAQEPIPGLHTADATALAKANKLNGYTSRADGNYFQGDFQGNPNAVNGVMFIDKYASGNSADCHLTGNISTNDGQPAILIIFGNLKVTGTLVFNGLIYTTGTADFSLGNVTINGSIISASMVSEGGSAAINYTEGNVVTSTTLSLLDLVYRPVEKTWKIIN